VTPALKKALIDRLQRITRAQIAGVIVTWEKSAPEGMLLGTVQLAHRIQPFLIIKGAKDRSVALPRRATAVLFEYLHARGIDAALAGVDATIPLLARLAGEGAEPGADTPEASLALWRPLALSPARLYALSKQLFARAAGDDQSAARLARASTHWLRHTYGTREAAGMPMPTLMREMGHADVRTTMKYVRPDAAERFRQVDQAFE
jgi:integrase